jgi:endogenous inhibitor of DNA gyrase (YacG/DUF329 family)
LQPVKRVPCPRCGTPAPFGPENKWRPFCSERCKKIDLGDWASERFRVPTNEGPEDEKNPGEKDAGAKE